ncbi:MAG: cytochrome c oxidase subunit II [Coleofasciculus sp. G1-WW12-02]|uniref:cytochrome c oxidase subunit II n=1 Tax=Coleofasciculus sp. G1-WW12-02 TaxID=3068483 RepID=UPI003300F205
MEKEKVPSAIITLTAGIVITLVSLWVGQNHGLMPEQVSEQAPLVDNFFDVMMTIGTALFLVVEGAIVIAMIRFRRRKGDDTDAEPIIGNLPLEAFWTAIPAIIVIGLGIYSVEVYRDMGGFEPAHHHVAKADTPAHIASMPGSAMAAPLVADTEGMESDQAVAPKGAKYGFGAAPQREGQTADLVVNVTGLQFAWIFNYADSGVVAGELHVPIGKDVQLNLSAQDVIHSFWVPQFRLKQDAIPGQETELRFVATKTGTYPVVCAELCGGYHGAMRTQLIVHTPEEYDAWLEENRIAQQQNPNQTVAVNPADLSESEFLEPYAANLGVDEKTLTQLHSMHES